jgi:hypothetical protein
LKSAPRHTHLPAFALNPNRHYTHTQSARKTFFSSSTTRSTKSKTLSTKNENSEHGYVAASHVT